MLLQITILSQSQRSWPICWSEICRFLTTTQQFNLVFNKEGNFIRKKQRYFREYGRPWQQKLSAFVTRLVSLSLLGGLPLCIVAPFSFPANKLSFSPGPSRKWPPRTTEPYHLPDFGTSTPMFQRFKFKFPEKIFFICPAHLKCPPFSSWLWWEMVGVTYYNMIIGTHPFGDKVVIKKCVTSKGNFSRYGENITSYHIHLDHMWNISFSHKGCFRELVGKWVGIRELQKFLISLKRLKGWGLPSNFLLKHNVDNLSHH